MSYRNFKFLAIFILLIVLVFILLCIFLLFKTKSIPYSQEDNSSRTIIEESSTINNYSEMFSNNVEQKPIDSYDKNIYIEKRKEYSDVILPYNTDKSDYYLSQTLFIGDSNTEGIAGFGHMPLQNVLGKRSMGIEGVKTKQFVWFAEYSEPFTIVEAVSMLKPRRIILNFGTNNSVGISPEDFVSTYKNATYAIINSYPFCDVIIASVLPVGKQRENTKIKMETIDNFNIALMQMCRENGYKFLDYSEIFKDENTGYMNEQYVAKDGIHLNSKGLNVLIDYVDNHQYSTTDNRPTVDFVPTRIEEPVMVISEDETVVFEENQISAE